VRFNEKRELSDQKNELSVIQRKNKTDPGLSRTAKKSSRSHFCRTAQQHLLMQIRQTPLLIANGELLVL